MLSLPQINLLIDKYHREKINQAIRNQKSEELRQNED